MVSFVGWELQAAAVSSSAAPSASLIVVLDITFLPFIVTESLNKEQIVKPTEDGQQQCKSYGAGIMKCSANRRRVV